ncbi:vitellin-degrading protease-like isoform X2 [Maniola jurtina]|uniref:vitellin-degrading protease-like isoform X2 n=1 Tax=Maniola jurtina TaxID=191418 RepID=UPI001E68EB84|nr:vitellin-degrading protease-like isoform X2 [Maniola jurtina]
MFKVLLFICIGYAASKPFEEDTRIVGGEDVDIKEVPYQVSVLKHGRHSCGGAIIDIDLILTAAHCVIGSSPRNLQVRAGSSSSQTGGEVYQVGDFAWNPDFTYSKMDSDVAVLWLTKPLELSDSIAPIPLIDAGEEINDGDLTVVSGWGNTRENGGMPKTLQQAVVPKVNEEACSKAYAPLYTITPTMLCAGMPGGGKDACQGDSGGPLVSNGKLAGIVSWGLGCARPHYPGVYAKISALREWIDDQALNLRLAHLLRM